MKLSRTEFEAELGIARGLPKDARKAFLDRLKSAEVYEKDDAGNEVLCKMSVVELEEPEKPETITAPDIQKMVADAIKAANKPVEKAPAPTIEVKDAKFVIPKSCRRLPSSQLVFKGTVDDRAPEERAYRLGMWALAARGKSRAKRWCAERGLGLEWVDEEFQKNQVENEDTAGGFLVPDEFENDLIDLRVQYGVARRNLRFTPMMSDVKSRPRRTGGLTAYFVGEGNAGTASTARWDRVGLTARKLMVLSKMSNEVSEDAVIDIGNTLAQEAAYAFANKEDECAFNGDGTSTYGGIVGIRSKLSTLNGVDDGGGLVLGAGNAYSELTLANFNSLIGRLPTYARTGAKFYASPFFHDSVMQKLAYAAGGNTAPIIVGGIPQQSFLGYPVELVEVLPTAEANSQICCLFGNLQQAGMFGDRRGVTIAFSEHATVAGENVFEQDEVAIRATQRFDINIHDAGDSSAAGPVVGLITASA